jgi:hypothetical protein
MRTIELQIKDKPETMSLETYARWLCLMEAVYIVCKKADELKVPTDKDMSWIKPISFQKYMDERYVSMLHEIEIDKGLFKGGLEKLDKINFDELDKKFKNNDNDTEDENEELEIVSEATY